MTRYVTFLLALALASPIATAEAGVIRVPGDAETIEEAVGTASDGDTIKVGAGRWCGASIDKRVNLVGRKDAVIVGKIGDTNCTSVAIGNLKVGFGLESGATGTTISHFTFDGEAAANDPNVLSVAVHGQGASDVTIEHNIVRGTLFAFSNKAGDGWTIRHNRVYGLTVRSGAGGAAIVVSQMAGGTTRPKNTVIAHNYVEADVPNVVAMATGFPDPDGHFAAVRLAGVEGADLNHNDYRLRSSSSGTVKGVGVFVTEGPAASNGGGGNRRSMPGTPSPSPSQPGLPSVGVDLRHEKGEQAEFLAVVRAGCDVTVGKSEGTVVGNVEEVRGRGMAVR